MADDGPWTQFQAQSPDEAGPWTQYAAPPTAAAPGVMAGVSRALEANLPFVDRAVAGAKSVLPQGYGGTGQDYAENLATEKAKNAQFASDNPWTNAVGGLAAYAPASLIPGGAGPWSRIGTGALTGFGLGGIQGASNSPDITNSQETGRNIAQGELMGGTLGGSFPAAAAGIGNIVSTLAPRAVDASLPTLNTIGPMKSAAYKAADELGAAYKPEAFVGLVGKIADDAKAANIDPDLHRGAASVISNLQRTADSGEPITLSQLDQKRQLVSRDASGTPADKFFGSQIRNNIDNFIANAGPDAMASGTGPEAAAAIQNARQLNTIYAKSEALNEQLEHARDMAGKSNSGANIDNWMRTAMQRTQDSQGGWTPDEAALLQQGIRGGRGQNYLRQIGKLAPTGLMGGLEALSGVGGALAHGVPGAAIPAALAGTGQVAKFAADRMTKNNADALAQAIFRGGKASLPAGQNLLPMAAAQKPISRAAMAAALAANADLQAQRNQATQP